MKQSSNFGINVFSIKYCNLFSVRSPQAAINAMNLEHQLSQYAFFNQQPSSQTHKNQQVSFPPVVYPQKPTTIKKKNLRFQGLYIENIAVIIVDMVTGKTEASFLSNVMFYSY